jgi:predicted alpha-1,6-mannanase (GH76 family)
VMSDECVRREAAQTDFYWWWASHLHELEISAALDEAERIAKLAEQNRIEGQFDLFWRTGP